MGVVNMEARRDTQQPPVAQVVMITIESLSGSEYFQVTADTKLNHMQQLYCRVRSLQDDWVHFTYKGQHIGKDQTPQQLGMEGWAVIQAAIMPHACMHILEASKQQQTQRRPLLLISTYAQLVSEVRHGIFNVQPHTEDWDSSAYSSHYPLPFSPQNVLAQHVHQSLLLAGAGFPAEDVPDDVQRALAAMLSKAPNSHGQLLAQGPAKGPAKCSKGSSACDGRAAAQQLASSMYDSAFSSASGWAEAFYSLCGGVAQLQLPLAMHMELPGQRSFREHVAALGCTRLLGVLTRHREALRIENIVADTRQGWGRSTSDGEHSNADGTAACINALEYQAQQSKERHVLPASAMAIQLCVASNEQATGRMSLGAARAELVTGSSISAARVDLRGTAERLKQGLKAWLGPDWAKLPWTRGADAGVVLAGGAVQAYMAMGKDSQPGYFTGFDLYIIAPHQAAYAAVKEKVQGALSVNARLSFPATNRKNSLVPLYVPDSPWACWETRGEHGNKRIVKIARMPYPNPATVVRCFDMASAAAWFDGKDVFLDERCAWCHANRMLLADPFFDNDGSSPSYCARLLEHAMRLPSYVVLVPGPLSGADFQHLMDGVLTILKSSIHKKGLEQEEAVQSALFKLLQGDAVTGFARWLLLLAYRASRAINHTNTLEIQRMLINATEYTSYLTLPDGLTEFDTTVQVMALHERMGLPFKGHYVERTLSTAIAKEAGKTVPAVEQAGSPLLRSDTHSDGQYAESTSAHGDDNSWYSDCRLMELPRIVWLAIQQALKADNGRDVPSAAGTDQSG